MTAPLTERHLMPILRLIADGLSLERAGKRLGMGFATPYRHAKMLSYRGLIEKRGLRWSVTEAGLRSIKKWDKPLKI